MGIDLLHVDCMEYMATQCDFVGCEIDADYFAAAIARFDDETRQSAMGF